MTVVADPRRRIPACLSGAGKAMSRCSPEFYTDMIGFGPTADIYQLNSKAAARRVRELIAADVGPGRCTLAHAEIAGAAAGAAHAYAGSVPPNRPN